jgi:hypothetical protein
MPNDTDSKSAADGASAAGPSPNSKGKMKADKFAELIRGGQAPGPNIRTVSGDVDLTGVRFPAVLSMKKVKFTGEVNFSQARFKRGLEFIGCRFKNGLNLSDARVEGPLSVSGSRFDSDLNLIGARIEGSASLNGARIKGDLNLWNASIGGSLFANPDPDSKGPFHVEGEFVMIGAEIENAVDFSGARFEGKVTADNASVGGSFFARVDRNSKLRCLAKSDVSAVGSAIESDVVLEGACFEGSLILDGTSVGGAFYATVDGISHLPCRVKGNFSLMSGTVARDLTFEAAHIEGDLQLQSASVGGNLFLTPPTSVDKRNRPSVVGKKAWLLGAYIKGDLDISGARIGDDLMMQNARVGQNFRAKIMSGFEPEIGGETWLSGAKIDGTADFAGVTMKRDLILDAASIHSDLLIGFDLDESRDWRIVPSKVRGKFRAPSATIGGDVTLMGLRAEPGEFAGSADQVSTGSTDELCAVDFSGAQIKGMFSLYSGNLIDDTLKAKEAEIGAKEIPGEVKERLAKESSLQRTSIGGGLRLNRAQILGGVVLNGVQVAGGLEMQDAVVKANIECKRLEPFDPDSPEPVLASAHRVDMESIEMTGNVDLTGLTVEGRSSDGAGGDLILRDARIRGRLELFRKTEAQGKAEITGIRGALRLDAAQISHVILSGHSFEGDAPPGTRVRVGLERAIIGRLQIVEPLPGTLDLSNLRVDRWDLPGEGSYLDMLERSEPFKQSNYIAIENALRNAGEDERADEVYVAMRRRDRRITSRAAKRFPGWLKNVPDEPKSVPDGAKSFPNWLRQTPGRLKEFPSWLKNVLSWLVPNWLRKFPGWFLDLSTGYGTKSLRLVVFMLALLALTVWVFNDPGHVEYKIVPAAQTPPPNVHPAPEKWSPFDATLFALRLHVPIIALGVHEDYEPRGILWETYGMAIVAASWVMWPLLLASASGFIRRRK